LKCFKSTNDIKGGQSNLIWDFYSGLNGKELLIGPLECHDNVLKDR